MAGTAQAMYAGQGNLAMDVNRYKTMDQRTHIYQVPDMYIASDKPVTRSLKLLDYQNQRIFEANCSLPPAINQIFLEVLLNSADGVHRSVEAGLQPGIIEVTMDKQWVRVRNGGLAIPIDLHDVHKNMYVPTVIFGTVLSSSNYEENRTGLGRNGIGVKACNIFSKEFNVDIVDASRNRRFQQQWIDNMTAANQPIVTDIPPGTASYVDVSYRLDFARFGYDPVAGYPDEALYLFARNCADISFTLKCDVAFNGTILSFKHITDIGRLYVGEAVTKNPIIHYELPPGNKVVERGGILMPENPNIIPVVELMIIDSSQEGATHGEIISFANCSATTEHGVHVKAVHDIIVPAIVEEINARGPVPGARRKAAPKRKKSAAVTARQKKLEEEKAKKPSSLIKPADVKHHLSFVISCRVIDSQFTSQSKTCLSSPTPVIKIDPKEFRLIVNWRLMDRLRGMLKAMQMLTLKKTDGKKTLHIPRGKGLDANLAGGVRSKECSLWVMEGDSAKCYAQELLALIPNARDTIGLFPVRGKVRNVSKCTPEQVAENEEISGLKKYLGLEEGIEYDQANVDGSYNFDRLRYGSVMIMADADSDGSHIKGLLANIFNEYYSSLLRMGYIMDYRTPWLRCSRGGQKIKFYTLSEYNRWKAATPDADKWAAKYYKGLGTSDKGDVIDDFQTLRVVKMQYDPEAPGSFKLAFGKTQEDNRKIWIENWRREQHKDFDLAAEMPITTFFRREFVEYMIDSLERAIPRFSDGLKRSQGQILWGAVKKWNYSTKCIEMKVAQFAAYVSDKTKYKHGEASLGLAIIAMAHNFVGSNNLPYLLDKGQFGSRMEGGKDAASPRYTFTKPIWWFHLVFRKEDLPILRQRTEEGKRVDPETFLPIIPMSLVNGATGIATGYSTSIPNYNPLHLVRWLKKRIITKMPLNPLELENNLVPWYNGFKGHIEIKKVKKKKGDRERKHVTLYEDPDNPDDQDDDDQDEDPTPVQSPNGVKINIEPLPGEEGTYDQVRIYGDFEVKPNGTIIVRELPIGRWTQNYIDWLDELRVEKKITSYRDLIDKYTVYFEINGFKLPARRKIEYRDLRLVKTFRLSNMLLLDEEGIPRFYDSPAEILEAFYRFRSPYYDVRKQYDIDKILQEIANLTNKQLFIRLVVEEKILFRNRPKDDVITQMTDYGITEADKLLKQVRLITCTREKLAKLFAEIQTLQVKLEILRATEPNQIWLKELEEFEMKYRQETKQFGPEVVIGD